MSDLSWDIRREGRAWKDDEAEERYFSAPEKMEMTGGIVTTSSDCTCSDYCSKTSGWMPQYG
jgi:hypothetical protein